MENSKKEKYFCVSCNIYFGYSGDGPAKCSMCGKAREDNLNQVEKNQYECIECNCIFSDFSKKPTCPNGCK